MKCARASKLTALCWALALSTVAPRMFARSSASAQTQSDYDALISEAIDEFDLGNFAEARALFERAHGLRPSARTLRGLGITSFELKRYVQAVRELDSALADTRSPLSDAQRVEVQGMLAKARRFVGKLSLELSPSEASVFIDDRAVSERVLLLDLGTHRISVRAPGYREAQLSIVVDGGQERTERVELVPLDLQLRAAKQPAAEKDEGLLRALDSEQRDSGNVLRKWWFWTGAGAVVVGATTVALVVALNADEGREPGYRGTAGSLPGP